MSSLSSTSRTALISVLSIVFGPIAVYFTALGLFCIPWVQRQSLYAHYIHTNWWDNLDDPESFGFATDQHAWLGNQVTPFQLKTSDGQTLYAWHVLPRALYAKHENDILHEKLEKINEFRKTLAYRLLVEDPESRLIINFHGNAGHLVQHKRPYLYSSLASIHSTCHLLAFSYRGYPRSTGKPNETGLIEDGISIVSFALEELNIPPSRIALVGESLGTAVVSGVAAHFGIPENGNANRISERAPQTQSPSPLTRLPVDFACVVLVSSFYDFRTLLLSYRIAGLVPVLSPLSGIPLIPNFITSQVRETWDTKGRLSALISAALRGGDSRRVNVQLIHALDDCDIPCKMSEMNYEAIKNASLLEGFEANEHIAYENDQDRSVRKRSQWANVKAELRLVRAGGHNRIASDPIVAVVVMKGLGLVDEG